MKVLWPRRKEKQELSAPPMGILQTKLHDMKDLILKFVLSFVN